MICDYAESTKQFRKGLAAVHEVEFEFASWGDKLRHLSVSEDEVKPKHSADS